MIERTPDILAEIGRAIHGDRWIAPLADDLEINRETLRRWLNGHTPLPPDHGMWQDLADVVERYAKAYAARVVALREIEDKLRGG